MKEYRTVNGETEHTLIINKSKFICRIAHAESFEKGLEYVESVSAKYKDATHNCYAVTGTPESNAYKFSDDGEPSGTAGQPIWNVLTKNGIYCAAAVVTRYFGGVKLGAGGLVGAYTGVTAECLTKAETIVKKESYGFSATLDYADYKRFVSMSAPSEIKITDTVYGGEVEIKFYIPRDAEKKTLDMLKGLTSSSERVILIDKKFINY